MENSNPPEKQLSQAELREHQEICLKALDVFDRICRENNFPYYLLGGSAIGGLRHKGFIPWDDDIDVAVLDRDRDAMERALIEGLGDEFEFISERTCERYPRLHGKILYRKRTCIDLFQLSKISDNSLIAFLQWWLHRVYLKIFYKKIKYDKTIAKENPVVGLIAELLSKCMSRATILNLIEKNCGLFKNAKRWINYNGIHPYKTELLPPEFIEDEEYVTFENRKCRVYGHVNLFLEAQYGDYMKLPPKEKQVCTHLELFEDL